MTKRLGFSNFNIHGAKKIRAVAKTLSHDPERGWLSIFADGEEEDDSFEITFFMPYETALAYASAINTVNDREAVEDYVPNEYTVLIPDDVWRKLNMGVVDAGKDTNSDS